MVPKGGPNREVSNGRGPIAPQEGLSIVMHRTTAIALGRPAFISERVTGRVIASASGFWGPEH